MKEKHALILGIVTLIIMVFGLSFYVGMTDTDQINSWGKDHGYVIQNLEFCHNLRGPYTNTDDTTHVYSAFAVDKNHKRKVWFCFGLFGLEYRFEDEDGC